MRILLITALLAMSATAAAEVYKWVGSDGRVHYTDRPASGAERIGIVTDRPTGTGDKVSQASQDAVPDLGPYTAFQIVSPEPNATLRDSAAKIQVSLLIDPPLLQGHRLRILVDGQPVPSEIQGTQITLQGLNFGSHRVQALIIDEFEATISYSPSVDFHLRKPLPESALP